jgi:DNA-binding SARP family transcriptional activator
MNALASDACLRIYTLGPSWIEWQNRPLDVCRRQARGLLYRLAARMQPVTREELCYTFWPDEAEPVAHRHLSHLISHLRESLPMPALVRTRSELVELDPQKAWSDAAAFWLTCTRPDVDRLPLIQQAVEIYRGPFLSGFTLPACAEYIRWAAEERAQLQQLYLDSLGFVMATQAEQADYGKAIFYARRYLRVDELAEDVHRRLMMLHVMTGDRAAALQQYERCSSALKGSLGVDPLPETRAVYNAIIQNLSAARNGHEK